jgi:hypothetical protein
MPVDPKNKTTDGETSGQTWGGVLGEVGSVAFSAGKIVWNGAEAAVEFGQAVLEGDWISGAAEAAADLGQGIVDVAGAMASSLDVEMAGAVVEGAVDGVLGFPVVTVGRVLFEA